MVISRLMVIVEGRSGGQEGRGKGRADNAVLSMHETVSGKESECLAGVGWAGRGQAGLGRAERKLWRRGSHQGQQAAPTRPTAPKHQLLSRTRRDTA